MLATASARQRLRWPGDREQESETTLMLRLGDIMARDVVGVEPDATLREHVRDDTIALLRRSDTPVLMVTHDAEEAVRVADRIHVMLGGRIVQNGTPAELYRRPASPFVAGFFGPLNRFKGWVVAGQVSTPLGPVEVSDLADGTAVDVLIRPEALRLARDGGATTPRFRIHRIRDLGTSRTLELQVPDGPILTVRMTGGTDFAVGDSVAAAKLN